MPASLQGSALKENASRPVKLTAKGTATHQEEPVWAVTSSFFLSTFYYEDLQPHGKS